MKKTKFTDEQIAFALKQTIELKERKQVGKEIDILDKMLDRLKSNTCLAYAFDQRAVGAAGERDVIAAAVMTDHRQKGI